ncbi:hypothetical protein [Ottowia thiooxydans]|uniref:hypothetical protein n=1 Tax=Ottowia thiooxydans TaxID=219182 RepID=UPI00048FA2B9|nr:hypothetical protein [Ottowia thiooxydans]
MLFLLSCFRGNNSNALSERPAPRTTHLSASIPPSGTRLPFPDNDISIGGTDLGLVLKNGQRQSAQELKGILRTESSFEDLSVHLALEEDSSDGSLELSHNSDRPSLSLNQAGTRRSVMFSDKEAVREFKGVNRDDRFPLDAAHEGQSDVDLALDGLEKRLGDMRKFVWRMAHWADIFLPTRGEAVAPGKQRMQELIEDIDASDAVQRVQKMFSEARCSRPPAAGNPGVEASLPELVFSSEQLLELQLAYRELNLLLRELQPELVDLQLGANWLKKMTSMLALDGADVLDTPLQRALVPITVVDDLQHGPARISLRGEEATVSRSLVPILLWGEFLAALDDVARRSFDGASFYDLPQNILVTLSNPGGQGSSAPKGASPYWQEGQ